ncbi:alpha/beta hydrolase family protein [Anaerosacchariphilus polymeriproducens]|uniref:Alpha/beta fold hydrolase n=1 Tax=Anaerosacchariphilus polymeriproducens TaxID=1812858 RepID=A0A371AVR6_9FIRM|nr:alpha/beta fold hydrolase [Anaerosacchariphilus polymeriproducens]RDU23667.1 alpha/beta fold hydrolase [Anaerosacchariphilus polymeriproducens]
MTYIKNITGIQQFDFQINRVLTYGEKAGDTEIILEKTRGIKDLSAWFEVWSSLGEQYKDTSQYLRAAYAYRMAEFFLKEDHPQKNNMFEESYKYFHLAFQQMALNYNINEISFMGSKMHSLYFKSDNERGILLICGGYDSFIEEFVPALMDFTNNGYTVILFEGGGQGKTLKNGLTFMADWESPTSCVLDYYNVKSCTMIGISWGGYLAVRAAAFEPRINAVVAYDVLENGFLCMTDMFPLIFKYMVRNFVLQQREKAANKLLEFLRKKSLIADWAMAQGMYITGTKTPYDFYRELLKHHLPQNVCDRLTCHVLLLAGEKDHYIPNNQFYDLASKIKYAKSLSTRMFTEAEGGEQHCQTGNYQLAIDEVLHWMEHIEN